MVETKQVVPQIDLQAQHARLKDELMTALGEAIDKGQFILGAPVKELATDTAEHGDGLVVAATHGRVGLQAVWTISVASRLLKRTSAPILLVPIVDPDSDPLATQDSEGSSGSD